MTDKFMSGWGKAEDKINTLIILCGTYKESMIVEQNARYREEMHSVSGVKSTQWMVDALNNNSNPKEGSGELIRGKNVYSIKTKEAYGSWFEKDYFKPEEKKT